MYLLGIQIEMHSHYRNTGQLLSCHPHNSKLFQIKLHTISSSRFQFHILFHTRIEGTLGNENSHKKSIIIPLDTLIANGKPFKSVRTSTLCPSNDKTSVKHVCAREIRNRTTLPTALKYGAQTKETKVY